MKENTIAHAQQSQAETLRVITRVPDCDVIEQPNSVRVILDMPGVGVDDLNIDVHARVLKVIGKTALPWRERRISYERHFQLSEDIDCDKISAAIKNGVLALTLPKLESAKVHKIKVVSA